jgi:hypothetical protein
MYPDHAFARHWGEPEPSSLIKVLNRPNHNDPKNDQSDCNRKRGYLEITGIIFSHLDSALRFPAKYES